MSLEYCFKKLSNQTPLKLLISIHASQGGYKEVIDNPEPFAEFYDVIVSRAKEARRLVFQGFDGQPVEYQDQCFFCTKFQSKSKLLFLLHLLLLHSYRFIFKITYYRRDNLLEFSAQRLFPENTPKNGLYFAKANQEKYALLHLFTISKCKIMIKDKKLVKKEEQIKALISQKAFFNGPEKHYSRIKTVEEFEALEKGDEEFIRKNEMASLRKSTPHFRGTPIEEFMKIYNEAVLTQKPKNLGLFLRQFLGLKGDLRICFINHLYTLLSYRAIDEAIFVELCLELR